MSTFDHDSTEIEAVARALHDWTFGGKQRHENAWRAFIAPALVVMDSLKCAKNHAERLEDQHHG